MKLRFCFILFCMGFMALSTTVALGQAGTYLEDEGTGLWEEDGFVDSLGEENGGSTAAEFDTTSGQYIGEEDVKAQEAALKNLKTPGIDIAAALEKDKKMMPDNIKYGAGTGVVIGAWLAILQATDGRDNVRYVSTGILGGILLGLTVGSKSLYSTPPPQASYQPIPNEGKGYREQQSQPKRAAIQFDFGFRF